MKTIKYTKMDKEKIITQLMQGMAWTPVAKTDTMQRAEYKYEEMGKTFAECLHHAVAIEIAKERKRTGGK